MIRKSILAMAFLLAAGIAQAADVTLSLNPNSTTEPAGYKLCWGAESRNYTASVDLGPRAKDVKFTVSLDLVPGEVYYFAATAYSSTGNESSFSNEVAAAFLSVPPKINAGLTVK